MPAAARFLIAFFVPIVLGLPVAAANYFFLRNTGELDSIESVIAIQRREGGFYGTAIHANSYAYKLALYETVRPKVVAVGSSRVLEIRQSFFKVPFVNLGRTVNYPAEAEKLVGDMLAIHKPELVLLGIDFWWFNARNVFAFDFRSHDIRGGELTSDGLVAPSKWLVEGKLAPRAFGEALAGGHPLMIGGRPMLGVQAWSRGNGFGPDGSMYYLGTIYGRGPAEDPKFADTLSRIARDDAQFRRGSTADEARLATIFRVVKKLQAAGVKVVAFAPPVAPTVFQALEKEREGFRFIDDARRRLATLRNFYDFHDPERIGAADCEFIDGFHGGDVVLARLLEAMAREPASGFSRYLDIGAVHQAGYGNRGRATADNAYQLPGEHEVDFLRLGCDKSAVHLSSSRPEPNR